MIATYRAELAKGASEDFEITFPEYTEAYHLAAVQAIDAMTSGEATQIFQTNDPERPSTSKSFIVKKAK
jgi:hypothetical protein